MVIYTRSSQLPWRFPSRTTMFSQMTAWSCRVIITVAIAIPTLFIPGAVGATTLNQSITTLSPAQVAQFKPYSYYASAGYCNASSTLTWSCGTNCEANPGFIPTVSGGDGDTTQWCTCDATAKSVFEFSLMMFLHIGFTGYDPTLRTVIVSHQGTNPEDM